MCSVVNIQTVKRWTPQHIYIGRANSKGRLKTSLFANPYKLWSEDGRAEAIKRYEQFLLGQPFVVTNTMMHILKELEYTRPEDWRLEILEEVRHLRGKILVCYCKPKACHGDLLARLANMEI